jgi:hypothetical protein
MMLTFPSGRIGAALLLLRALATAISCRWIAQDSFAHPWSSVAVGVLGLGVFLGLYTPGAAFTLCVLSLALILHGVLSPWAIWQSVVLAALGLAGAGAYSIDARLFGRKVIRVRP